jgi:hypothetical protein
MSTVAIVIVVAVGLLALLAIGGILANARWRRASAGRFETSLDEVNRQLAAAHAQDKGWEPGALEEAARRAFTEQRPGTEIREQALVAVVDEPGVEQDKAVFRFVTEGGTAHLTLGRTADGWVSERLE